jgi:hypothetical protein
VAAGNPNFTHITLIAPAESLGMDNLYSLALQGFAAPYQPSHAVGRRLRRDQTVPFQRRRVDRCHHGPCRFQPSGDDQRRFRHSVAGVKGLRAKTAGAERLAKPFDGFRAHGLGAIESEVPGAQIELLSLIGRDLPNT